jgi:hypothetical protein
VLEDDKGDDAVAAAAPDEVVRAGEEPNRVANDFIPVVPTLANFFAAVVVFGASLRYYDDNGTCSK